MPDATAFDACTSGNCSVQFSADITQEKSLMESLFEDSFAGGTLTKPTAASTSIDCMPQQAGKVGAGKLTNGSSVASYLMCANKLHALPSAASWLQSTVEGAVSTSPSTLSPPTPQPRLPHKSGLQALKTPLVLAVLLASLLLASADSTHLQLELDLRQLRQAVASTNVGNGSALHSGGKYELPGSPEELTTCLNSHQPDNNGTSWTEAMRDEHPYFKVVGMWWSSKVADVPMTITTQLSWNRKWQLKAMCRSWAGPIAAVIHMPVLLPRLTQRENAVLSDVSPKTLQRAIEKVAAFHARIDQGHPCKLDLMLLAEPYRDGKSLVLYPVNTMRNYARLMARTPLIGLIDVDLIVSSNLRRELLDADKAAKYIAEADASIKAAKEGKRGPEYSTGWSRRTGEDEIANMLNTTIKPHAPSLAYVVPAFATRGGELNEQIERAEMLTTVDKNVLIGYYERTQILRFDWGSNGHKNTDYDLWFRVKEPYTVEWADRYEPWLICDRLSSSWADSRFRGYGKNKIVQIRTFAYDGYELKVHPNAFLIHRPHLESSGANAHMRSALNGDSQKSSMYGHNSWLYKGIQRAMAFGNYTVVVDPATEACRGKLSWWAGAPASK